MNCHKAIALCEAKKRHQAAKRTQQVDEAIYSGIATNRIDRNGDSAKAVCVKE